MNMKKKQANTHNEERAVQKDDMKYKRNVLIIINGLDIYR